MYRSVLALLFAFAAAAPTMRADVITYNIDGVFGPSPADTYYVIGYDISDHFLDAAHPTEFSMIYSDVGGGYVFGGVGYDRWQEDNGNPGPQPIDDFVYLDFYNPTTHDEIHTAYGYILGTLSGPGTFAPVFKETFQGVSEEITITDTTPEPASFGLCLLPAGVGLWALRYRLKHR